MERVFIFLLIFGLIFYARGDCIPRKLLCNYYEDYIPPDNSAEIIYLDLTEYGPTPVYTTTDYFKCCTACGVNVDNCDGFVYDENSGECLEFRLATRRDYEIRDLLQLNSIKGRYVTGRLRN